MNDLTQDLQTVILEIEKADNVIIISHENPDGDAVGSSLALCNYIQQKGKQAKVLFHNSPADTLTFLPGNENIVLFADAEIDILDKADLAILVDVNSIGRICSVGEAFLNAKCKKIMLDHHHNSEQIADIYAVDPNAAATGEIIYKLLRRDNINYINCDVAVNIYVAILTDTGGFRFGNTTPETHAIAAELLKCKIDTQAIYDHIYNAMPHKLFVLLGRTYAGSELYLDGKLNIMTIKRDDLIELGITPENLNNFSENSLKVGGTLAGILITQMIKEDGYKLSFRSKGEIDIRQVALSYGGGGHRNAAGAKVHNVDLDLLKADLIQKTAGLYGI